MFLCLLGWWAMVWRRDSRRFSRNAFPRRHSAARSSHTQSPTHCGDSLNGRWQVGHVKPYRHGGQCTVKNCLPICVECNRLRWSYSPNVLRFMLLSGRYAKQEIRGENRRPTELGERLIQLYVRKTWSNRQRIRRTRT